MYYRVIKADGRYEINRWVISREIKKNHGESKEIVQQKFNRNYKEKKENQGQTISEEIMAEKFQYLKNVSHLVKKKYIYIYIYIKNI